MHHCDTEAPAPTVQLSACAQQHLDGPPTADCIAWPVELSAQWIEVLPHELRTELTRLAAQWLAPWSERGIDPSSLIPRLGEGKSDCSKETPSRVCPLVMVRGGEIRLHIPPRSRLFRQPLTTCHHGEKPVESRAKLNRAPSVNGFRRRFLSCLVVT